jgi:hypothetical protein
LNAARLAQKRRDRGGEKRLVLAESDDERALQPRTDEHPGVVVMDDDEGEVSLELAVRGPYRVGEIPVVVALDQVRDDLGIGFGCERVTLGGERFLDLAEVLDDPVEHDCDLAAAAASERVRVLLGDATVCRPARMAEPGRRVRVVRSGGRLQELEIPDGTDVVEPVGLEQCEPGRVVTAVLEPLEPVDEELLTGPAPDVSDDPAQP